MPGKHATDHQVRRYMGSRKDGYSQAAAAARAGFSERTGRRIEADPVLPSQQGACAGAAPRARAGGNDRHPHGRRPRYLPDNAIRLLLRVFPVR